MMVNEEEALVDIGGIGEIETEKMLSLVWKQSKGKEIEQRSNRSFDKKVHTGSTSLIILRKSSLVIRIILR